MLKIRTLTVRFLCGSSIVLCACLGGLVACNKAPAGGAAAGAPPVGVAAAVVRRVSDVDDFTGRLEATEAVAVRPRVGGYIEKVHFRAGQDVKKGELLITIDPLTYRADVGRAQGELAAAQSRAALAKLERARGQTLFGQKAISKQEDDQLSATLVTSVANVQAAESALQTAKLNLGYTEIRAPISGRISRALITEGNLVAAGSSVLTTIESLDQVYAYFDASEAVFLRFAGQAKGPVHSLTNAPVAIRMGLINESGYPHEGRIESFDNRLNVNTGAIRTRAVFDNRGREFTPGLYARLRLVSGTPEEAVLVPDRAIGTDQSKRFVVVVGADDVAAYRDVELGSLYDGMRVVRSGLKAGERIVVEGLQRVRPGAKVTPEVEALDEHGEIVKAEKTAAPSVKK